MNEEKSGPTLSKEKGGPAFPTQVASYEGMHLRDYFAAKAMQSLVNINDADWHTGEWKADTALTAYKLADEMLKAREQ